MDYLNERIQKAQGVLLSFLTESKKQNKAVCINHSVASGLFHTLQEFYPNATFCNSENLDFYKVYDNKVIVIDNVSRLSKDNVDRLNSLLDMYQRNGMFIILTNYNEEDVSMSLLARVNNFNYVL